MTAGELVRPELQQPVVALTRINGVVLPGDLFIPDSAEQSVELLGLEAIELATSSLLIVAEQSQVPTLTQLCVLRNAALKIGDMK